MDIVVEIGNNEEKHLIAGELSCISSILEYIPCPPSIKQVIVPFNFDKTVNELQGTDNYTSQRGVLAVAKNVWTQDGISLVFSPLIFSNSFDWCLRFWFYIHEVVHAINNKAFPIIEKTSSVHYRNLSNIYTLFDEYDADRKAFRAVESLIPAMSFKFKSKMSRNLKSFISSLINETYFRNIKIQIEFFRYHGDIDIFLKTVFPIFDDISKILIHTYAHIDHFQKLKRLRLLLNRSKFVNEKTLRLIEFFRMKHEQNDLDLSDGLLLMDEFMGNFGMKFEDHHEGNYCHVLDI
jgi:hypothetical protein